MQSWKSQLRKHDCIIFSKKDSNTSIIRIFHEHQCGLVDHTCVVIHLSKFVVPKSADRNQKIPGEHGDHAQIKECHTETKIDFINNTMACIVYILDIDTTDCYDTVAK